MRSIPFTLSALLALTPAAAVEQQGNTLKFSDEEMTACREEGGCVILTHERLLKLLKDTETAACRGKA